MEKRQKTVTLVCDLLMAVFFCISVTALLYPIIFDRLNDREQQQTIVSYDNRVAKMDPEERARLLAEAEEYNEMLRQRPLRIRQTEEQMEDYLARFNVGDDGIIGHLTIPCIDVDLMIYHTVEEPVLQVGSGHLPGTSFPIGGKGTHAVLSGHRGLTTAALFTDLDRMVEGDKFYVSVLDDVLTYQVDQIKTVLPNETSDIAIDPEMDYCTLLTCTPYGINSHRLLVRGHRVPTDRALNEDGSYGSYVIEAPPEVRTGPPMEEIMAVAGAVLLGIAAVRFGRTVRNTMKKRNTGQEPPEQ